MSASDSNPTCFSQQPARNSSSSALRNDTTRTSSASSSPSAPAHHLTHLTPAGEVHMVDISSKASTTRHATAICTLTFSSHSTYNALLSAQTRKGDVLAVTRIAAIQAVKQTSTLIPLAHPALGITGVSVDVKPFANDTGAGSWGVHISTRVSCHGQTGIEMEALTGATAGALAMYDMLKGVDRNMVIGGARVVEKTGGKSGTWKWDEGAQRMVRMDVDGGVKKMDDAGLSAAEREDGLHDVDEWNRGLAREFSVSSLHDEDRDGGRKM